MYAYSRALDTTRIASQVCHQWRDLILQSSSLWGRLIDINYFFKCRSDKWREEIVRRSGTAPLWINADFVYQRGPRAKSSQEFFFQLMNNNWHRIHKLVITRCSSPRLKLTRSMFSFPAPILEYFELRCHLELGEVHDNRRTKPLFANHVPKLRSLHIFSGAFDQRAPWLGHLCTLVLDDTYSLSASLAVLSATHSLQELKIVNLPYCDTSDLKYLPFVCLSRLKYLEYQGRNHELGAVLLDRVAIPVNCSVIIQLGGFYNKESLAEQKQHLLSIIDIFIRHSKRAFQSLPFSNVHLAHCHQCHITLKCQTSHPVPCLLSISTELRGDSDANLLEAFLKKMLSLDFSSVTKLKFALENRRLNPCFGLFFSRLPSVEIIYTNLVTLSQLAHFQNVFISQSSMQPKLLFPKLKVVALVTFCWGQPRISFVNQVVASFLLLRLREGHPITTLDMTHHLPLIGPPDLRPLAAVKGLKVLYRLETVEGVVEYTYGKTGEMFRYNSADIPRLESYPTWNI